MTIITNAIELLKLANVTEFSEKTLPKILDAITNNKIKLEGDALKRFTDFTKSSNIAMTTVYSKIWDNYQKSFTDNDSNSISYTKNLLGTLKSHGVSDSRFEALLGKIINNEHEVRTNRDNKGFWLSLFALIALIGGSVSVSKTYIEQSNKKYPFWYTK